VIIDVDLVIGVVAIGVLGLIVLVPELGIWRQAVAPRLTPREFPKVVTDRLKWLQRKALSDLLPYYRTIRPNVIKNKTGSYLTAWRIAGADVGTLEDNDILNTAYHIAATIGGLPAGSKVQLYARRAPFREYVPGVGLAHPIARLLDELRAELFLRRERVYHTERTLALTWQPPTERTERLRKAVSVGVDAQLRTENELLRDFEEICESLEAALSTRTLTIGRLGEREARSRKVSDLLSFVSACISGKYVELASPPAGTDLNEFLSTEVRGGYEPKFGEFEVSAIAIKSYPDEAVPLMLDKLTELKVSHVLHVSFTPQPIAVVQKELRSGVADFNAAANFSARTHVDPDLNSAKAEMVSAIGKAAKDYTRHGLVSVTLLVRARSRDLVRKAERAVEAILNDCQFRGTVRRLGALETVLSTLPSSTEGKKREYLLDALTIAKLFPIHEASLGRKFADSESLPSHTPPLTYALGPGGQLFREHGNVKDVFHRYTLGRPGVGKSVDESFISAMYLSRMPDFGVTVIDRGPSAYQACRMFDGEYYRLLGSRSPGFAMFADAHEPSQARELFKIIKRMCELSGVPVTPDRDASLKDGIRVMGTRPRLERSFLAFWEQLQDPDRALKPALRKYTRLGDVGALFDATQDTFETGRFNVVDVELVMDLEPALLIPILETIIWKTRTAVRRMKVYRPHLHWRFSVDEVNNSLMRHPLGAQYISDMLLMGRKENFSLSLASNSVMKFATYPGCSDILLAAQTRVYFNDSSALGENRKYYEQFELPERGIELLPNLPDHTFILHQPEANIMRVLTHKLDRDVMAIIGTSRTVARVDEFVDRFPASRYGAHRWKLELLKSQSALGAADRLAAILELGEQEAAEAKLVAAS
jgi:type IV secretory pathway VirB4 component